MPDARRPDRPGPKDDHSGCRSTGSAGWDPGRTQSLPKAAVRWRCVPALSPAGADDGGQRVGAREPRRGMPRAIQTSAAPCVSARSAVPWRQPPPESLPCTARPCEPSRVQPQWQHRADAGPEYEHPHHQRPRPHSIRDEAPERPQQGRERLHTHRACHREAGPRRLVHHHRHHNQAKGIADVVDRIAGRTAMRHGHHLGHACAVPNRRPSRLNLTARPLPSPARAELSATRYRETSAVTSGVGRMARWRRRPAVRCTSPVRAAARFRADIMTQATGGMPDNWESVGQFL